MSVGWNGFGLAERFWTVLVLLVGAGIGSWRTLHDGGVPCALVLLWAYGAIIAKHLSASAFNGAYPSIILTTGLCMILFAGSIVYVALKQKGRIV